MAGFSNISRSAAFSLLLAGTVLAGCERQAPDELPPPPPTEPAPEPGDGIVPGSQADFVRSVMSDRIYFDTDRYNIDGQDQAVLQSQAQWMSRYPDARVTIEGHCDERGTREYNLALGERRANAAKNYLASLGVSAARITTVSYGKERPVATASNPQAWAQNRRAVTIVIER